MAQSSVRFSVLDQRNPEWKGMEYEEHDALYDGEAVLKEPILSRLMFKGSNEPEERYEARKKTATYTNYSAPILDKLNGWLASEEPEITSEPDATDPYYTTFLENCDRQNTDFHNFMSQVFGKAMLHRRCWVQVELPKRPASLGPNVSLADEDKSGARNAYLVRREAAQVINWDRDENGSLTFVVVRTASRPQSDPLAPRSLQTVQWAVWTAAEYKIFRWVQTDPAKTEPEAEEMIACVEEGTHSFEKVPFVEQLLPAGVYVMGKIRSQLRGLFNKKNGLDWNVICTLNSTPVLKSKLDAGPKKIGGGYGIQIDPDDDMFFLEPSGGAHSTAKEIIGDDKDELYRVTHQMADAANNSAGSMNRSADSKGEDKSSTEIVLGYFSEYDSRCRQEVLNMVAAGRGDTIVWTVAPVDNFNVDSTMDTLQEATQASMLRIPSRTFAQEVNKKVARAMLPDLPDETMKQIDQEIEENSIEPGSMLDMMNNGLPGAGAPDLGAPNPLQGAGGSGNSSGAGNGTQEQTAPGGGKPRNPNALRDVNSGTSAMRPAVPVRSKGGAR